MKKEVLTSATGVNHLRRNLGLEVTATSVVIGVK